MNGRPLYLSLAFFGFFNVVCLWLAFRWLPFGTIAGWLIGGFLAFTLVEYLLHRYFFHIKPTSSVRTKIQFAVHGNAHPREMTQMMMKPTLALVIVTGLTLIFYSLLGLRMLAFMPGFLGGYGLYLFLHFAIHAYRPPKSVLRQLWVNHHVHHRTEKTNFGVSSPLWDIIFRTKHQA